MESSEEDDDFPPIESITPQSKIDSLYQSHTEKGIRKVCCELLDLKDAVENLCGDKRTKYLAFLRLSEEVVEMEHEMVELRKHISAHGLLVQDLMMGVCRKLEEWSSSIGNVDHSQKGMQADEFLSLLPSNANEQKEIFLERLDVLLAEHRVEEALEALDAEERNSPELKGSADNFTSEASSYKSAILKRKSVLEKQLAEIIERPSLTTAEMKQALLGLIKLGKGPLAHQLLLKSHESNLKRKIDVLLPSCSVYPKTCPATICEVLFSKLSSVAKESGSVFGDNPVYTNKVIQWAEWEIENFVRLVKENAPSSDSDSALDVAGQYVQASLSYCSVLESQGLRLSKLLLVLLRPYVEEVLELKFRRARKVVLSMEDISDNLVLSPHSFPNLSMFMTWSGGVLVESGMKFMNTIEDILSRLTPMVVVHFRGSVLTRLAQLYDRYADALVKSLPSAHEEETLIDIQYRAETDSEQLAVLGVAFTIIDELLPVAIQEILNLKDNNNAEQGSESNTPITSVTAELKEWRRHLQSSYDKLRDHFCRQYIVNFIYSRANGPEILKEIYIDLNGEDLYWESTPLPSLLFQALFSRLQMLATVAGDVLLGREKLQKNLLARLTETVLMWVYEDQHFWESFENESVLLKPLGLQQLILDMHFTVEIARFAGYSSKTVHQHASAIMTRAIRAFSARGMDQQSALPEDEWFVESAKLAINKLLQGGSGSSDASELDDEHIILHDEIVSDSDETASSLSSVESTESFASASMGELESPVYTDPEA